MENKMWKRVLSVVLSLALVLSYIPAMVSGAVPRTVVNAVADPGTASTWESMMGTDADGNRYAGRVWVDKSVYKNGDTAVLNTGGQEGSSFQVSLAEDEAFQIVFSALGSTMTTTETNASTGPMDVVLVLDTSTSMDDEDSQGVTRLERTIEAANALLADLLTIPNVRIAIVTYNKDSETVLPLAAYTNGIELEVTNYYNDGKAGAGVVTAYDNDRAVLGRDSGYTQGTNLQSGIDRGFNILANATGVDGRVPVAIVLTDGQANRASQEGFYEIESHDDKDGTSASDRNLYLSTLLNAAYTKTKIEANYGRDTTVYTIGVDVSSNQVARLLMNPADPENGFGNYGNDRNRKEITEAYKNFEKWEKGETVTHSGWTFDHNYPAQNGAITDAKIAENILYADTYYDVSSADLRIAFEQIYEELSSGVFNPISSSTTSTGGTGVENTPLIYVDFIGQYMEIKKIQSVSLFGASYDVIENGDGTYTVEAATGYNPTTNEAWNTAEDVRISITEEDGVQKLEIRIDQEILPIILEQVTANTVGGSTSASITEIIQNPLRVFYTVGLDSEVLLPNGELDISKIQGYSHINDAEGTVDFYSNRFGVMNQQGGGDAHVGFKPAPENRYYYHQSNQGIFTAITNKQTGAAVTIPENEEYGMVWDEEAYELTWMTYAAYQAAQDTDRVYTYVTYYHSTPDTADAATAAEEVTYLIYADWKYLKGSVAFYDADAQVYLNDGKAVAEDQVAATVDAYIQNNPNAEIYAVLGVGSLRTSRLHNMDRVKRQNLTATAELAYSPEYTHETASQHNDNDVVVWLGNNGKLTVSVDTGIALTKNVTELFGNADDTYPVTVTVPAGTPVVKDVHGNDVTAAISTFAGGVLTVNLKAGQTVYISGIPGGTVCTVDEAIPAGADYYLDSKTDSVTVPTVSQALASGVQFAPASVTNAPYQYGNLTVAKDVLHHLENTPDAMLRKEFTFRVKLPAELAGKTYAVDKTNAPDFAADSVTVGADGSFTVVLKDAQSVTVLDLPAGTAYEVTEEGTVPGYENTTGTLTGTVEANADATAHFVNTYTAGTVKPAITVTGTKHLEDVHGTYTANEAFIFQLAQYTENGYVTLGTAQAKAGQSYTFNLAELLSEGLALGEHYFRITEVSGNTPGMTYNSTRGLFVVHVTDTDANGEPEFRVENYANTQITGNTVTKDFTNTYDVERTFADVNIQKTLVNNTGVHIPMDIFHFRLVNNADDQEVYTATTDASGNATIRVGNLKEGSYHYTLTEVNGGMAGMQYDETVYTVHITVTNAEGTLTAVAQIEGEAVNTDNTVEAAFANTYTLDAVRHTIAGEKVLNGRPVQNGEFSFSLYQTDSAFVIQGSPLQTVANAGNDIVFAPVTYTKIGTYYYSVKENAGTLPGVTYDTTHYHIAVTVGIDSQEPDKLAVTDVEIHKIGANSDTSGNAVFVNTYKAAPTEYTLGGTKVLHGRAPRAGEFSFSLYQENTLIETVTNAADGTFRFSPITYDQAEDVTYTIREEAGNVPGVTYTGAEKWVEVTVSVVDDNGVLKASADKQNADIRIENTYTASPARVTFSGTKTLAGGSFGDGDFTFRLYQTKASFDIQDAVSTAEISTVNGGYTFYQSFTKTGTYFFVVTEDAEDPIPGVVYDRSQYRFTVQVMDLGDGQLRASVTDHTTGTGTLTAAELTVNADFVNAVTEEVTEKEVYYAGSAVTHIDGQKVAVGDELTYFITYTNYTGEDVVADIMDTIPNHTSYVEGTASHNGTYAGTHLNWVLNVPKGESVTVSFNVKVNEPEAIFTNTAVVRDGVNTYYTNEVVNHTVENELKKDVYKPGEPAVSIDGRKVYAGEELLYKIRFTNATGDTAAVTITDAIPANTTYVANSADAAGVYDNGIITWNIPNIPAWATVTVTFRVTVNENVGAAQIKNQATADDGNNQYESRWVSNYTVEDEVKKTVANAKASETFIDGEKVQAGDELIYAISYKNTAREAATVTITDKIPAYTAFVEGSAGDGVYAEGTITWTKEVPAGETVTVSFKVKVQDVDGTAITNTATVEEGRNTYTTNGVSNSTEQPQEPTVPENSEEPTQPTDPAGKDQTEENTNASASPVTGDDTNVNMWFALMIVSCLGVLVLFKTKKEETENA